MHKIVTLRDDLEAAELSVVVWFGVGWLCLGLCSVSSELSAKTQVIQKLHRDLRFDMDRQMDK